MECMSIAHDAWPMEHETTHAVWVITARAHKHIFSISKRFLIISHNNNFDDDEGKFFKKLHHCQQIQIFISNNIFIYT